VDQSKKIGLVSAEVLMGKIPVFNFSSVRGEDEGRKEIKPPRKDFVCETFVIKDYERFNPEEEEREIKQTKE